MAAIGLKYPCYAVLNTSNNTYSGGTVISKAIQADININKNDVVLRADDSDAETDQTVTGGTITLGVAELGQAHHVTMLGHTLSGTSMIAKTTDIAPYLGFGFYVTKIVNNVKYYRAVFLKKVQFAEPNETNATKETTTTFKTPAIDGKIMENSLNEWKIEETFSTESAAQAFLDNLTGVLPMSTTPVSSKASGTYTTSQMTSVTLTAGLGETIKFTTNGLTPNSTNGTVYTTAFAITASCALKAYAYKSGQNDSPVATYEYVIS